MKKFLIIPVVFSLFFVFSCEMFEQGGLKFEYSWSDAEGKEIEPPELDDFYAWAELLYKGEQKTTGPVAMADEEAVLRFESLPYDTAMVMKMTIRISEVAGKAPEARSDNVAYFCNSQEFELKRGKVTVVKNGCKMEPGPALSEESKPSSPELKIAFDKGSEKVEVSEITEMKTPSNKVEVLFKAPNDLFNTAILANDTGFTVGKKEFPRPAKGDDGYYRISGYDLNDGLPFTNDGSRIVAIKLRNHEGFESLQSSITVFLDTTAPVLNIKNDASAYNGSSTVVVTVSSNETLAELPVTGLYDSDSKLLSDLTEDAEVLQEGVSFRYQLAVAGNLEDGDYKVKVKGSDIVDNMSNEFETELFSVDSLSPELDGEPVITPERVAENKEYSVTFSTKEDMSEGSVTVSRKEEILTCTSVGNDYTCIGKTEEGNGDSIDPVVITLSDKAGNTATFNAGTIFVDRTAPVLTYQIVPGDKTLNSTEILQITLNASEELSGAPTTVLAKDDGGIIPPDNTETQGLSYIYTYPTLADGTYSFTADATDLAGHEAVQVAITSIISDSSVPTVVGTVDIAPARIRPGVSSTITFTASETMNDAGDTVEVKVGNKNASCATTNGLDYSCTYNADNGSKDTIETVSITLTDSSGNTSTSQHGTVYVDRTAPILTYQIVPGDKTLNSTEILQITLNASEELSAAPTTVLAKDDGGIIAPSGTETQGLSFIYTYPTLADGTYSFRADATDLAGHEAVQVAITSIISDSSIPQVVGNVEIDPARIRPGVSSTIEFTASETMNDPGDTVEVKVGNKNADCSTLDGLFHSCAYNADNGTKDTIETVSITLTDSSGNTSTSQHGTIYVDRTAPVLTYQIVPGDKTLNSTEILQITLNASEELSGAPTTVLTKEGGGIIAPSGTETQGLSYIYTYPTLADGTYSFTADATDLAGHEAVQITITSIISDSSIPQVVGNVEIDPARIRPGVSSTIEFTASETMNDPGDTVEVKVGNKNADCSTLDGLFHSCAYNADNGTKDTIETVSITLTDSSGNTSTSQHGTIFVDRTPPEINISLNKNAYNASDTILISVMSSEVLNNGEPVVTVSNFGTLANPTKISDFSWIYEIDITLLSDGDYTVNATAEDLVGHSGSDSKEFSVETSIPDLVSGSIDRAKAGLGITYTVDFEITKPVKNGIPIVKANEITLSNCSKNGSETKFVCTRTVGAEETDSTVYAVTAALEDLAGNKNTVTIGTVLIDKTPPSVIEGTANLTIDAGSNCELPEQRITTLATGSTGFVSVQISEVMEEGFTPVLRAKKAGADDIVFSYLYNIGLMYYFEYKHPKKIPPSYEKIIGEYELSISLKDEAGNESSPTFTPDKPFKIGRLGPTLVINQGAVSYNRSPWGRAAATELKSGGDTKYTIPANDYYEIGPSDIYEATDRLPAGAFMVKYGTIAEAPVQLKAYDSDGTELRMEHSMPESDGTWLRGRLWSYNATEVSLTAIDSSCRETAPVKIKNGNWLATMNRKVPGDYLKNPNKFISKGFIEPTLEQSLKHFQEPWNGGIALTAQTGKSSGWNQRNENDDKPTARWGHALAYDSARGKVVLFGGWTDSYSGIDDDTWEWDGNNWTLRNPTIKPSARSGHALAYDSARGKVVLFGGYVGSGYDNDTWEWNGESWNKMNPANKPSARYGHALAFDSVRGKVVLFGGDNTGYGNYNDETWEWDGTDWTQRKGSACTGDGCIVCTPTTCPSAREGHALVYDSARGKVVLFGGDNTGYGNYNDETWEWDGENWTLKNPANKPSARSGHALAFDSARGKVVLFGGEVGLFNYDNETWEWDGHNWTQKNPTTKPPARGGHALAYDSARGKVALFGGNGGYNDTWKWDGVNWEKMESVIKPPARWSHALCYDSNRGKVVLFGGNTDSGWRNDTWEWDGSHWKERIPANKPSARSGHALAYDSVRKKVVLFGGTTSRFNYYNDTWEWDGNNWAERVSANKPSARHGHALVYDSTHEKVVLFGGRYDSVPNNETWEWNGENWTQKSPDEKPLARSGHALAFDSARGKVVLFGGYTDLGRSNDTWEWDGNNWIQKNPTTKPSARDGHALAFDSVRGKVVLFGGWTGSNYNNETWEWDGNSWTERVPDTKPSARSGHALAYDSARGKVIMFGGSASFQNYNDTWEWDGGSNDRAAQIMNVALESSGITDDSQIQSVSLFFNAGGFGDFNGTPHEGVELLTWKHDRWVTVASNVAEPDNPAPVTWETTDPVEIETLLNSGLRKFNFAVVPAAPNGFLTEMGSIATDHAEVIVRYTIGE
ncbi:MAG: Kelch repeat-containing protein [bacterium]